MVFTIKENVITRTSIVVLIIPLCVFLVLVPYSRFPGWNPITIFLFWFIILPGIILFLSPKFLKKNYRTWKAMVSMIIFYGFIVFMIYKHFETDFFMVIMISFLWNSGIMAMVNWWNTMIRTQWRTKVIHIEILKNSLLVYYLFERRTGPSDLPFFLQLIPQWCRTRITPPPTTKSIKKINSYIQALVKSEVRHILNKGCWLRDVSWILSSYEIFYSYHFACWFNHTFIWSDKNPIRAARI